MEPNNDTLLEQQNLPESAMYLGDQPLIGGIRQKEKKTAKLNFIPSINFHDKKVGVFILVIGLLIVLGGAGGYLYLTGFFNQKVEPTPVEPVGAPTPSLGNVQFTFSEKQLPERVEQDKLIEKISAINGTSIVTSAVERLVSIKAADLSAELKQIKVLYPE